MPVDKKQVIRLLERVAVHLELKGENPFKVSAYRKAAAALERNDHSLEEIDDFTKIKGIGKGTASVIEEFINNDGESDTLKQLEAEVPAGLIPLLHLPGLGGKKLAKIYQNLGVIDAESLKEALESGKVEGLEGFGKKSAEKILKALEEADTRPERLPIALMLPLAEKIEDFLSKAKTISRYSRAGSLRRMRETIKDLDFIVSSDDPLRTRDELLAYPDIKEVIASGETKVSIVIEEGYDIGVDFRIVAPEEFASTLHHFTGSKEHNVAMRQLAKKQNEKINEYGIEHIETGEVRTFENEEEFFKHFGLQFIPPEVRENYGEVEKFQKPVDLVEHNQIRGDLHMHSTWSDGAQSIKQMAEKAKSMGYEYIAITDHSKYLRVANGLNEDRLRLQRKEIEKINSQMEDFHIFAGVEMDILPNGSLDFDDEFLKEMDFVIASIHSSFQQSESQIMKRMQAALENPYVHMIAHPTGRLIGRRDGYAVDLEKLIQGAKDTGTILELNANPNRLDLSWEWLIRAQEEGVNIAVNTDAHSYYMLHHMEVGVGAARKGWLRKETVMNTWSKDQLLKHLNKR